ncbi:beta-ketoacyl synthase N-terminal-like domain-containing protein [Tsukamurella sp. 8F]|uniref:beta-ketoacyl synthase N-terminal-like domain-containing protein n=1 Tax=unclassified Tsukamurella TaxID=2633480 RepID=UPI0023B9B391|nr:MULTISPECIES: beta-ketoacyl synthase N-terminal-like domain-containing protein [unclassified Tsukamurella]MDF0532332.1 beta-ketoacyl synthase N-terminal-like domain-containing protein [Tsukamurella sp. 8J]MDF0589450.1 beta-ketoacyl synthase N-terminal-like domain-containing protein [Tsukamurella sp. 8F]
MHTQATPVNIAGIGAVTGYGTGVEQLWEGLMSGKPAAHLHPAYLPDGSDAWFARISEDMLADDGRNLYTRALCTAVVEAVTDAQVRGWRPGPVVGLINATAIGDAEVWRTLYTRAGARRDRRGFLQLLPSTTLSEVMRMYRWHGPVNSISSVCASSGNALLQARSWLDEGRADDVVVVGTDLLATPEILAEFVQLGAAIADVDPLDACRPFQTGSRGFSFGEAAVAMVLSRRPAQPYAQLLGGALSHDAYHAVSIDPGAEQIMRCATDALRDADVTPDDIGYLNAHGPGTSQCDAAETRMHTDTLGGQPAIFSVKPLVGHCQGGACGLLETSVSALAYDRGTIPAPHHVADAHPRLLDGPTPVTDRLTLKTSLGMGGHNSAVVLAPPTRG